MNLTREKALELHRQMWSDMQRDLGDCPADYERVEYKERWCEKHFPDESIENNCFLCEYTKPSTNCRRCPIVWPNEDGDGAWCTKKDYYYDALISELLALPERGKK